MGKKDSCLAPINSYMTELGAVCQQVAKGVWEVLHKQQGASIEPETPEGDSFLKQPP